MAAALGGPPGGLTAMPTVVLPRALPSGSPGGLGAAPLPGMALPPLPSLRPPGVAEKVAEADEVAEEVADAPPPADGRAAPPPDRRAIAPPDRRGVAPPDRRGVAPPDRRATAPPNRRGVAPPDRRALPPVDHRALPPVDHRALPPPPPPPPPRGAPGLWLPPPPPPPPSWATAPRDHTLTSQSRPRRDLLQQIGDGLWPLVARVGRLRGGAGWILVVAFFGLTAPIALFRTGLEWRFRFLIAGVVFLAWLALLMGEVLQ